MQNDKTTKIGRKPSVSDKEIIHAGNQLTSQGQNVNGFSLRRLLGKGDPKRLDRVWSDYSVGQAPSVIREELTPDIQRVINDASTTLAKTLESLVQDISRNINDKAQEHIASAIGLADLRKKKADEESHDAILAIEELEQKLRTLEAELKDSEQSAEELRHANSKLEQKLNEVRNTANEQSSLLEKVSLENTSLMQTVEEKDQRIRILLDSNSDLRADKASLQKEVDYLNRIRMQDQSERESAIQTILSKLEDGFDSAA